jgi:hypothetical protein
MISDGGDNSSRYIQGKVKNAVRESDAQVCAIKITSHRTRAPLGGNSQSSRPANGLRSFRS